MEHRYEDTTRVSVTCKPLGGVACFSLDGGVGCNTNEQATNLTARSFQRHNVPCLHYSGCSFLTTLLFSIFLGFFGVDRFLMG